MQKSKSKHQTVLSPVDELRTERKEKHNFRDKRQKKESVGVNSSVN